MSTEAPIVCSLGPAEMRERSAEIGALGGALVAVALQFPPGAEMLARLEAFVAAESRCCAFLDFAIEQRDRATVVTIGAPPGAERVLHELAGRF